MGFKRSPGHYTRGIRTKKAFGRAPGRKGRRR